MAGRVSSQPSQQADILAGVLADGSQLAAIPT